MGRRHWQINTLKGQSQLSRGTYDPNLQTESNQRPYFAYTSSETTLSAILVRMTFHCSYMQYVSKYHILVNSVYRPKMVNIYL